MDMCNQVSVETLPSWKAPGIMLGIQVSTLGMMIFDSYIQRDGWKGLLEVCEVYFKILSFSFPRTSNSFQKENG